jgi:hypothetical protein
VFCSRRPLTALVFASLFTLAARAQSSTETTAPDTELKPVRPVAQWRVYASDGRSMQNWHGQAQLQSINIERAKQYRWGGEFGYIFSSHVITQPRSWFGNQFGDGNENVPAGSLSLLVRHRYNQNSHFAQPFIELSSGPMWARTQVPAGTSRFNFISQLGVGYVFHPDRRASLVLGWRIAHISNAGYSPRNPGLNINSLMIGTQLR